MTFILARAVEYFCNFLYIMILIRVIVSWLRLPSDNWLLRTLYTLTEPILAPIRSVISKSPLGGPGMMLDFSPIIAYFLIVLVQNVLISIIARF